MRRRYALAAVGLSVLLTLGGLLVVDLYLHHKYRDLVGMNAWGYRGPVVGKKQPGEWRIVVLGESTAFGYGVHWTEAWPAQLERLLTTPERKVTVVNLAYNNEGAHSYAYTLTDYAYLKADTVLFYSGYNDLGRNTQVYRHESFLFRWTGYWPILPLIASEKAMAIRYGGRLEDAYWGRATTFRPTLAQRTAASALEAGVALSRGLDQLGQPLPRVEMPQTALCGVWSGYCERMAVAVRAVLGRQQTPILITQPYIHPSHRQQQAALWRYLPNLVSRDLQRIDLGDDVIDLHDPALSYDGMHLTAAGNAVIADRVATAVRRK